MNHCILLTTAVAGLIAGVPVQAGSQLGELRALVAEQERQIRMLEEENARLRADAASRADRSQPARVTNRGTAAEETEATPARSESEKSKAEHTVVAGDNLIQIGRRFGVSADAIAKANGIGGDMIIHPGQILKIPSPTPARRSAPGSRDEAAADADADAEPAATHTVAAGESFYSISRQLGVSVESLMKANPGIEPTSLHAGRDIRLPAAAEPASRASLAPAAATSTTIAHHPSQSSPDTHNTPSAPDPDNRRRIRTIMIDCETSYGEFAAKHGTTPERLNQLNGLDLDARTILAKGSELYVPAHP